MVTRGLACGMHEIKTVDGSWSSRSYCVWDELVGRESALVEMLNNMKKLTMFSGPAVLCPSKSSSCQRMELWNCFKLSEAPDLPCSSVLYGVPESWKINGDHHIATRCDRAVPPADFKKRSYDDEGGIGYNQFNVDDPVKDHSRDPVGENKRDKKCELCFQMVDRDLTEDHALVCSERAVLCPAGCGASVPAKKCFFHMRQCKLNTGMCHYCGQEIHNSQLADHHLFAHALPLSNYIDSSLDCPNHPCSWYSEVTSTKEREPHLSKCSTYTVNCLGCKKTFPCRTALAKHQCSILLTQVMIGCLKHPAFRDYTPSVHPEDTLNMFFCGNCQTINMITNETEYFQRFHCTKCSRPRAYYIANHNLN